MGACWGPGRGRSRLQGATPVSPGASREGFTCWASEWSCDPGATTLQATRPSQTFLPAPRKGQARPSPSPDFRCGACLSHPGLQGGAGWGGGGFPSHTARRAPGDSGCSEPRSDGRGAGGRVQLTVSPKPTKVSSRTKATPARALSRPQHRVASRTVREGAGPVAPAARSMRSRTPGASSRRRDPTPAGGGGGQCRAPPISPSTC